MSGMCPCQDTRGSSKILELNNELFYIRDAVVLQVNMYEIKLLWTLKGRDDWSGVWDNS